MALSKSLTKEHQQSYFAIKEKYDNLRLIADQLSLDNKSLKTRIEGVTTLSTLLHESREEILTLKKHIKQLEEGVGILQSRLHRLGGKTDVILGDSEVVLPGISKQILDSLVKENLKLKQQLQGNLSGLKIEESGEVVNLLENQIKDFKKALEEKEKELTELKKSVENSGDEKNVKIIRLKEELKELKYQDSNRDSLCQSLTKETQTLRTRLAAVSHLCQEFISQLDKQQDKVKENVEVELKKKSIREESPFLHLNTEDKNKALQDKCQNLEQDKHKLAQQLHDVIQMNTRWQVYNSQREEFVADLNKQIKEKDQEIQNLEDKVTKPETLVNRGQATSGLDKPPSLLNDNQQEDIDRILITARKRIDSLEAKANRYEQLLSQEKDKNKNLEEQLKNTEPSRGSDREKLLEQQLMVYRDDFSQERRDRERVQGKLDTTQQQREEDIRVIASLKREVALLKRQQDPRQQHQQVAWNIPPSQNAYTYAQQPQNRIMTARGNFPPVYGGYQAIGQDCTDGVGDNTPSVDGASNKTESDSHRVIPQEEDMLQCPKCNVEFPMSEHVQFLNHIDQCCS